jgi:hypothetical protein
MKTIDNVEEGEQSTMCTCKLVGFLFNFYPMNTSM